MTEAANEGTPDRAAARQLERVTFEYSATQDRLLARMQGSAGERHAAWLTQRLVRRLVKALLSHLDKTVSAEHTNNSASDRPAAAADPTPTDMMMSFRHQAALMRQTPSRPVPAIDTQDPPLLTSIQARLSRHRALLTMELPGGPVALSLNNDHAWQLLQVLLNVFQRADWPIDIWPSWMREGDTGEASKAAGDHPVLH